MRKLFGGLLGGLLGGPAGFFLGWLVWRSFFTRDGIDDSGGYVSAFFAMCGALLGLVAGIVGGVWLAGRHQPTAR